MKLKKKDVDFFLLQWIENDLKSKMVFNQYDLFILVQRIVKCKSLRRIADEMDVSIGVMHLSIEVIMATIEEKVSEEAAKRLRTIDLRLRAKIAPFF